METGRFSDSGWMFLNDWERALAGMRPTPTDDVMETLFRVQLGMSVALQDITWHATFPSTPWLETPRAATMESDPPKDPGKLDRSRWQRDGRQRRTKRRRRRRRNEGGGGGEGGEGRKGISSSKQKVFTGQRRFWVKPGSCSRSDQCPHEHDPATCNRQRSTTLCGDGGAGVKGKSEGTGNGRDSHGARTPSPGAGRPACELRLKGSCRKGTDCKDWHFPPCRFYK